MRRFVFLFLCVLLWGCSENYTVPNHTPVVLKVIDNYLMTAYGEGGLLISNETSGASIIQIFPPREMHSIDDFAVDGELIFVLDSRNRDYVAVFSFDGNNATLITPPHRVQGGPFNGIAATGGNLVVSGGTTFLNRFQYNREGEIFGPVNFGRDRGHPDVILSEDGQYAFLSTDFGIGLDIDRFGIMSLFIGDQLEIPLVISELGIAESGMTLGLTSPVGFPIQSSLMQNHLLVAHGGGLSLIELVEGGTFGNVNTIATDISGVSLTVDGSNAYLIGYDGNTPVLLAFDLADISSPALISQTTLDINDIPTSVAVGSLDVFIAAGNSGILRFPKISSGN